MSLQKVSEDHYDFVGIATAYNVKCGDGRTIKHGAFAHQDGTIVPLVWRHQHNDMGNILGHVLLKEVKSPPVVRAYSLFNQTQEGQRAKSLVQHGDVQFLSIYANDLVEIGANVERGQIREVSLVLAGRNPGARIEDVVLHSGSPYDDPVVQHDSAYIHSGIQLELYHAEPSEKTVGSVLATLNKEQRDFLALSMGLASGSLSKDDLVGEDSDTDEGDSPSLYSVWETLNDDQKSAVAQVLKQVEEQETPTDVSHSDDAQSDKGDETMSYNIFENDGTSGGQAVISHDDMALVLSDAMRGKGTLKDSFLSHAGTYGIDNIEVLFPDAQYVNGARPHFIVERQEWVSKVIGAAKKVPFSRIKSSYADITADEARARGYITGAEKFEEVFPVFSRVTTPQTVYKKQKLDRDDYLDITDFDVVVWLKDEMRLKYDEELARACLISDGRTVMDPDKISTDHIRPIYGDSTVYVTPVLFDAADDALALIDGITESRKHYRGSGSPTMFCSTEFLTQILLVRDTTGRRIYDTTAVLAAALRVKDIVEVPFMTNVVRNDGVDDIQLQAIIVNMADYTIGADKGGQLSFFEDFDIDFNQMKYLYEARVSAALTIPKSAVVIEQIVGP